MIYDDFLDDKALQDYAAALNRRAQALQISGRLNAGSLRGRILDSAGLCEWCGRSLLYQAFEVDHIVALGRGGTNEADNLVVSCPDCNRSKSGKHPARFAQEQVARGSRLTPLISRLLAESGIAPLVQRGLFDESPPPRSANNTDDSAADSPPDEGTEPGGPPPYRWG